MNLRDFAERLTRVLNRGLGLVIQAKGFLARSKKSIAGLVTAVVAVLAVPELGVDPDVSKAVIALAVALGVWVAPKNRPTEPVQHA